MTLDPDTCFTLLLGPGRAKIDAWAKERGLTVTFCDWHPNPEYRVFASGSLLSRNNEYPSGLVLVDRTGKTAALAAGWS